jgi:nitrogen fixation protein NifU and related proteins
MTDPLYREIILEHWQSPQNYGVITDADFDITASNPLCGDEIRLTGKVRNGKLKQIAFVSEGCAISKASASLFTEKIKGGQIEEIKNLTEEDVLRELGVELTLSRKKCALLIYKLVKDWYNRLSLT